LPFYQGKKDFGDIFINNPAVWTSKITKESIKNDILMSVRAPVGDVNINPFEKICIGRGLAAIRTKNLELQKYLFEYISQNKALFQGKTGTTFDSISTGDLKERKIPLPPKEIQQKIVDECAAIDNQTQKAAAEIEKAKTEIDKILTNISSNNFKSETLANIAKEIFAGGDAPKDNFSKLKTDNFNIPIFANGAKDKGLYGYTNVPRVVEPCITISASCPIRQMPLLN
jgi:restriction endonuclease S subunit